MMLKIGKFVLSSCATNCYFVYEEGKNEVIFFDPGDRGDYIYEKLKEAGLSVAAIYLTHGHFDHIEGCDRLRELSGAKVYALEEEKALLEDPMANLSGSFGISHTVKADGFLKDGQVCTEAGMTFKVLKTPGHTKGGCCFYFEEAGMLIAGDTLFEESVGRTDFPGGSMSELVRSVREVLFTLPDETKVYPGHGDMTTIGHEKQYNAFV